jgi:hypothetical protein
MLALIAIIPDMTNLMFNMILNKKFYEEIKNQEIVYNRKRSSNRNNISSISNNRSSFVKKLHSITSRISSDGRVQSILSRHSDNSDNRKSTQSFPNRRMSRRVSLVKILRNLEVQKFLLSETRSSSQNCNSLRRKSIFAIMAEKENRILETKRTHIRGRLCTHSKSYVNLKKNSTFNAHKHFQNRRHTAL